MPRPSAIRTLTTWTGATCVEAHSFGWVTARAIAAPTAEAGLVGFVNVVWDGWTHA